MVRPAPVSVKTDTAAIKIKDKITPRSWEATSMHFLTGALPATLVRTKAPIKDQIAVILITVTITDTQT